jgi:hypothetical protein
MYVCIFDNKQVVKNYFLGSKIISTSKIQIFSNEPLVFDATGVDVSSLASSRLPPHLSLLFSGEA